MPKVIWYFRKKRELGNFSIENSFRELYPHFENTEWEVEWREASWFSEGLINRIKIALEARRLQADIIHITGDINFAAILLKRRKVILTVHDNGFLNDYKGIKRWLLKKMWLDWPLKRCTRVVAVSNATKQSILQHTSYPSDQIAIIPSLVPSHFRPRTSIPNNPKPVLLHIGLAPNKNLRGHALAIQGLDVKLRIIGEPSQSDIAMLESLSIDFEWMSKLTDEQMQRAYETSDLLLFCSILEGFGMPILEAKAVGLPVITSNIEPMCEVGHGYARLAEPSEPDLIRFEVVNQLKNNRTSEESAFSVSTKEYPSYVSIYRKL